MEFVCEKEKVKIQIKFVIMFRLTCESKFNFHLHKWVDLTF